MRAWGLRRGAITPARLKIRSVDKFGSNASALPLFELWDRQRGALHMPLLTVSIGDVEDELVAYFHDTYGTPVSALSPATDLKKLYGFSGTAWVDVGDKISELPWMDKLSVDLTTTDMMLVSTLGQLAYRIVSKMPQVVSAGPRATLSSVKTLMVNGRPTTSILKKKTRKMATGKRKQTKKSK